MGLQAARQFCPFSEWPTIRPESDQGLRTWPIFSERRFLGVTFSNRDAGHTRTTHKEGRIPYSMNSILGMISFVALFGTAFEYAGAADPEDARSIIAEAKNLEQRDDYEGALRLLNDLEATQPSNETHKALKALDSTIERKHREALAAAKLLYDKQDFAAADKKLTEAIPFAGGNPILLYDRALILAKTGHRDQAMSLLRAITMSLSKGELLDRIRQQSSHLAAGTASRALPVGLRASFEEFNKALSKFEIEPSRSQETNRRVLAPPYAAVCGISQEVHRKGGAEFQPLLAYNESRCLEYQGKTDDAAQLLTEFVDGTKDSTLLKSVQDRLVTLHAVSSSGSVALREAYSGFVRSLDSRNYRKAFGQVTEMTRLAPDNDEFAWQRLVIADALGDVPGTREAARAILELDKRAVRLYQVRLIVDSLDSRRAAYEQSVLEAETEMETLARSMFRRERVNLPTRLDRIRRPLQTAMEIFPLGPEANLVQAMFLQHNSQAHLALRSWDIAVAYAGNVTFYALSIASNEAKNTRALARVTLMQDAIRIDAVDGFSTKNNAELFASRTIPWTDLKLIEAESYLLRLRYAPHHDILIRPLDFNFGGFQYPGKGLLKLKGGSTRRFSNSYLRLFERYANIDTAKYGSETMTFGEIAFASAIIGAIGVGTMGVASVGAAAVGGAAATTTSVASPLLVPGLLTIGGLVASSPVRSMLQSEYDSARNATLQQLLGSNPFLYLFDSPVNETFRTRF